MKRTLPLCLLGGCLWIGPDTHDERLSLAEIGVSVVDVTPEAWSACTTDEPVAYTVTLAVADHHAGEQFDAWVEVDGGDRVSAGTVTASDDATVALKLDSELGSVSCAGECVLQVRLGLERAGATDTAEVELVLLAGTTPALGSAWAVDATGAATDLATAPTQGSPPSSLSDADWPAIGFTLVDPQLAHGFDGGDIEVAACPPGTSSEMVLLDAGPCTRVPAIREELFDTSGAAAFLVDSTELGEMGCEAAVAGGTVELHALVRDYTCGGSYAFPLTDGAPLVVSADCDGDLASWPEDCDDLDAERSPSAVETWYDGVDSDCSGGSDDDQDGDGVDALGHGGTDCDDLDAQRYPGALEVCDGKDDDCDGAEAAQQATLTGGGAAVNFPSIQEALDVAADGDTVTVCDGRYDGAFTVRSDITLTCGSTDVGACTLDGVPGASVLTIGEPGDALDVTVSHVTVTGASAVAAGGGIDAREAASLELAFVVITGNTAGLGGGLAAGGTTTLSDVEIRDNTATTGGGGILLIANATLDLDGDTVVSLNDASAGGGLYADGPITVTGLGSFEDNVAAAGGAIALRGVTAGTAWTISDIALTTNEATGTGGAVDAEGDGTLLTLTDVVMTTNEASLEGGAVAVRSSGAPLELTVDNATITSNEANLGGAIAAHDASVTLLGGTLSANVADDWGGAAYLIGGATFTSDGTEFADNSAEEGGAVYTDGSAVDLTGGALKDNAAEGEGGGMFLLNGATAFLRGTIQVDGNLAHTDTTATEQAAYVKDEQLVACPGVQVLDPMANAQGAFSFAADCFEVTASVFDALQCNGC